ncbi:class I SAM-dependent methyltransferase [Falsiroseomonas sp. E2-1-a20]|uniref:class I SAM-dependent methyltransferase n=1 Tax=Falsiroseomonas sp. E2-1-a20 TaxID=3239300 RepID=UPI003F4075D0
MGLRPGLSLLDVGCGIGRHLARAHGCRVTGVDLTEAYVAVAEALTRRVGLQGAISFRHGSALALPFTDGAFDGAYMLHVGMNVPDRSALFAGVRRVLRPGAVFAVHDVMRLAPGALDFPLPWTSGPEASFVESPAAYRRRSRTAAAAGNRSCVVLVRPAYGESCPASYGAAPDSASIPPRPRVGS